MNQVDEIIPQKIKTYRNDMKLTQAKLKEILRYNPNTGEFVWLKNKSRMSLIGIRAGYVNSTGYRFIGIDNKNYKASRLAWLYVHGYFPENDVDHKDQDKSNDIINNLREVSNQCNSRNCGNPKNNISTVKGVFWEKGRQKWKAYITINNLHKHIGYHVNFLEAVCHRLAAEQCLDWSACDLSSPAYQYVKKHINIK